MNWIDRKYKELLGRRSFSENMKKEGWERAQGLLDAEFGQQTLAGNGSRAWQIGLGSVIVAAVAGTILWSVFAATVDVSESAALYQPRTEPIPVFHWSDEDEITASLTSASSSRQEMREDVPAEETPSQSTSNMDLAPGQKSGPEPEKAVPTPGLAASLELQDYSSTEVEPELNLVVPVILNEDDYFLAEEDLNREDIERGPSQIKEASLMAAVDEKPDEEEDEVRERNSDEVEDGPSEKMSHQKTSTVVVDENDLAAADAEKTTHSHENEENEELPTEELEDNETKTIAQVDAPELAASENSQKISAAEKWHLAFPVAGNSGDVILPNLSGRRFSIAVSAGVHHVDKHLMAGNEAYLNKRHEEEMPVWTMSTGMDITYYLNRRWTFGTGFTYSEYGEELQYRISGVDTVYLDGRFYNPHRFRNNLVGLDSTRVIDSINRGHWDYHAYYEKNDTAAEANNGRTTWTYLEIPLLVGYRFGSGALRPWLRTGVSLGLPVHTSFRYLNSSGTGLESREQAQRQVAPFQWSVLLQMGIDYKIARHWSLLLAGNGSLQLNSSLIQNDVRQQYYRLGGSLGVAYHF